MGLERICTHIRIESDHRMDICFRIYSCSIFTYGRLLEVSRVTDTCAILTCLCTSIDIFYIYMERPPHGNMLPDLFLQHIYMR